MVPQNGMSAQSVIFDNVHDEMQNHIYEYGHF